MLNEFFELDRSRKAAGVAVESWHKNYGSCPKQKTFRLLLGNKGEVVELEPMSDIEKIRLLRKWEVSNGTSFPAFNVGPLFRTTSEEANSEVASLKKLFQSGTHAGKAEAHITDFAKHSEKLWVGSEAERINRCLKEHPKALATILGDIPEDYKVISELVRRAGLLDAEQLKEGIRHIVIKHLAQFPKDTNEWVDSLIATSARTPKRVSLILELDGWQREFQYPANHEKVQSWINSRLMANDTPGSMTGEISTLDAFGFPFGRADSKSKFPDVDMPRLGRVKLRAMSGESPCQARYGRTDSMSFPAGQKVRQAMKDSLEWLCDPTRKGKTWEDITGACGFTKRDGRAVPISGVLLAYPSILPGDPPELAALFGGDEQTPDSKGAKFERCAERVTAALRLAIRDHPDTQVRIFALAKADKARTKLLLAKHYEARQLIGAAKTWLDGCRNIPEIALNIGTHEKPHWINPVVPFPAELVKCLNVAWLQGGTRTDTVHGLKVGEGISLFIDGDINGPKSIERPLFLAVSNGSPLLLAVGHADHRRDGKFALTSYPKHITLLPSLLGLLLYKSQRMKGGYMHSAPFLVGQMLALADTLHKEYCQHIRKGELPPQLVGNALMPVALINPIAGLARLSERIAPYQAWANTVSGEGVGLAKWTLKRFKEVASELKEHVLPDQCTDGDKAQILLGYLARLEGNEPNQTVTTTATEEPKKEGTND